MRGWAGRGGGVRAALRLAAGGCGPRIHPPTKGSAGGERGIIKDFRVVVGWLGEGGRVSAVVVMGGDH